MTWNAAQARVKFGADVRLNDVINKAAFDSKGTFTFNNLQDYMNNNAFAGCTGAADGRASTRSSGSRSSSCRTTSGVTSDLTLNLGLRYESSDVPLGMFGATDPQVQAPMRAGPGASGHEQLGAARRLCLQPA